MTLTFQLGTPGSLIGPGIPMIVSSTVPKPPGSNWSAFIAVARTAAPGQAGWQEQRLNFVPGQNMQLGIGVTSMQWAETQIIPQESPVTVSVQVVNEVGTVVDSGTATGTWETQAGLGALITNKTTTPVSGGFTESDRATLSTTHDQAVTAATAATEMNIQWQEYETVTLPSLQTFLTGIQTAVTGVIGAGTGAVQATVGQLLSWLPTNDWTSTVLAAATCEPIDVDISAQPMWGITLEITAYPPEWHFSTPDLAWSARDLAVIRFYRAGQLQDRQGVHTISHTVGPLPGIVFPPGFAGISIPWVPANYRITVDFASGVCGQLFAQRAP